MKFPSILFVPCAFFLTATAALAVQEKNPLFTQANAKYAAGDFKAAASIYEQIIDSKKATEAVYYNLGNAQLRLGKKGAALLAYERAYKILPRDADLRWNMTILKNALPDHVEESEPLFFIAYLKKVLSYVTIDETSHFLAGALIFLSLLAILRFIVPAVKSWAAPLMGIVWLFAIVLALVFAFKWFEIKDERAVVLQPEVYAHNGPSDKETKAFLLHEGAEGKVIDETKGWYYITLENKETGWVPKESCEII